MSRSLVALQRWWRAHPGSRWWALAALSLAVLFGTSLGVHEDMEEATAELAMVVVLDDLDFEPPGKGKAGQKVLKKAPIDKRGGMGGADKLDQPQGVLGRVTAFQVMSPVVEPPREPLWRRLLPPQPERLLRPPDA